MPNKNTLKLVVAAAVGTMLAGFIMNNLRGTGPVDQARDGFN